MVRQVKRRPDGGAGAPRGETRGSEGPAINYVWDNRHPVGTEQPNAYTDRTTMIVLRSGAADAGGWVQERRNVGRDIARLHGASARPVQVAVTADTDNTGESARAGFSQLHFVAEQDDCVGVGAQPAIFGGAR